MSGKRSRGVGKLRPSVVLYNEDHKDGEHVGEVVRKDLTGSSPRADLLLVVGTSLRVPGTKRIVREFSKAVRLRATKANANAAESDPQASTSSSRRTPVTNDEGPITSVYLNLDFPVPTRDWEGVFDVWLKGDAQSFAMAIEGELEKADAVKEAALERKRKREEVAAEAAALAALGGVQIEPPPKKQKLLKKKASKPPLSSPPTPPLADSQFTPMTKVTPVSSDLTRTDRLPSPDEETESSQRAKLTLRIPPFPYSRPSHGQKATKSQADLKNTFPVTAGKPTAKLK